MKYLVEVEHQRCPDWKEKGSLFVLKDSDYFKSWQSPIEIMLRAMFPWGPPKIKIEALTWK